MTNQNNDTTASSDVQNAHGDKTAYQVALEAKAQELIKLLSQEPEARLIPSLRITEAGVLPDVKLVLVDKSNGDGNTSEAVEGADKGDDSEGSEPAPTTEPIESPTA